MTVVTISDKQFLVKKGDKLFVPLQQAAIGETLSFKSLMTVDGSKSVLEDGKKEVSAKVLAHVKGEKVLVFKKKRRKRYRRTKGHRQQFTQIEVLN